jgi:perosamine synthetase
MIPVSEPTIGELELAYISDAVRSGWISSEGKYVRAFEELFASSVSRKHGITVNNGTSALILAFRALDLPEGSEVVIPSFTIISCALACIYNGLVPVFIDSEKDTWNIDASLIEAKVTRRTKAIMPVHIYGHPVDLDAVLETARKHKLAVIEDFAEAIGSEYKGRKCGGFGDVSCASFYANKTITTGEGGMCLTDSEELAAKLRSLKDLAFVPGKRFVHHEAGFNFRMTNVQAAMGLAQLERIDEHVQRKRKIGKRYMELFDDLEKREVLQLPVERTWAINTYWMFGIVLNEKRGLRAERVMAALREKGVQSRPFFCPMHMQPLFERYPWFKKEHLLVSEGLYEYGLYLPSGLSLSEADQNMVARCVREVLS